jgi:hypothetical protein
MKRQSLLLLGWLLLATPVVVQAQFNYTVTNQTVSIIGYTGTNDVVLVPSTIDGLPVTSIGTYAFEHAPIHTVSIPNSVTSIGYGAFSGCTSLTDVMIPNSVTNIGDYAFDDCTSLTNIIVDPLNPAYSSVDGVLFNLSQTTLVQYPGGKLGDYTIPDSVTTIGTSAFADCNLTSITIPNSVTSIASGAFEVCTNLTSVTIPNSVTSVGYGAFEVCTRLSNVTIGNSIIGWSEFAGCTSLTSVTIPNSVTNIEDDAFAECTSLTNVTIPDSVTRIWDEAFWGCTSLTKVTIGNSVISIGGYTFQDCTRLSNVTICNSIIGGGEFAGCTSLTNVMIGNGVTWIGSHAFDGCTNLTNVYFQGNAPTVDSLVFSSDNNATAYYLPGTVGWSSTFAGRPTALWTLPYPLVLNNSLGVRSNQFGFTVSWATNASVVVEASTDLNNPNWSPVQTNTLDNGVVNFTDPQWTKYPRRFYRVRSQ